MNLFEPSVPSYWFLVKDSEELWRSWTEFGDPCVNEMIRKNPDYGKDKKGKNYTPLYA